MIKIIKYFLLLVLTLNFGQFEIHSQTDSTSTPEQDSLDFIVKPRFGVYGHYNLNFHTSSFEKLPNTNSCCMQYTGGFGTGFSFGGLYEYPLDEKLQINFRFGYASYDGILKEQETKNIIVDGKSRDAIIGYSIDAQFGTLGIEPMAAYQIYPDLYARAGFRLAVLMNSHYVHKEEILEPSDRGTFNDGNTYHNLSYGEIPSANSFHAGFQLGFGYEVTLDKKKSIIASPEFFYSYNFTPVAAGISWTVHSIKAGIALKYKNPPPPPPPPAPPLPPPFPKLPLPAEPPVLTAAVQLVKIDSNGKQDKNFNIKIEDFISLNMRPLLNYVFFDSNSTEIPVRYKKLKPDETKNFSIKNLQNLNAMETYYQVLNIIGMRLRAFPEAKIEIVGCNANNGGEKNNQELSRNRAGIIRDYLRDVWGIDGLRMPVKARNLPDKSTRNDEPGGDEENRRAEIMTDDLRITEPVTTVDTLRAVDEYNLKFITGFKSAVGIKKWNLKAVYDNKDIYEASGEGTPKEDLDWKLNGKLKNTPKTAGNIFYYLNVTDSLGQTAVSAKNRLPIEQLTIDRKRLERIADKEFEYYSLILFDFGKSDLRFEHKKVVDFVKERIFENSKVYVRGYTDSMGDEDINKRISDKRAKAVSDRIRIPGIEAFGIGEADLLYPNNTPEGRFYCRTVQIVIETPVTE